MAEAAFSEDGKYFSAISQDGRLRIWDTETNVLKQEYTPDLHLTSPPSCIQWICTSQSANTPKKGSKRKSSVSEQDYCIALGTGSGKILIYSVTQAKVETVLQDQVKDIQESDITSLDWNRKSGLYSCNKNSNVIEWDLSDGAVRNKYNIYVQKNNKQGNVVTGIKIVPQVQDTRSTYIVAASWQISIWKLFNGEATTVATVGYNTDYRAVLSVATLNGQTWLVEGSQKERLLSFWDITLQDSSDDKPQINGDEPSKQNKRQRKNSVRKSITPTVHTTPTYTFILEDAPKSVFVEVSQKDEATEVCMAATTRSGVVHYYGHKLNGTAKQPIKPSVTLHVSTDDARPLPAQCCRMQDNRILLGYSKGVGLCFERIEPDLTSKTQVLIRGEPKPKKVPITNEVNKVISDPVPSDVTLVDPMGGVSRKRPTPGGKLEVPMEARLANLALDVKSRSKSAVNQNLTKLLVQGLHSKDKQLILTVLQRDEAGVAARTVASLPADYVPQLLQELAEMATRKTSQCAFVCTWLSALLRSHSAMLLASAGPVGNMLTQILATFTNRRSHLCQLLNLKGRVELTLSQRKARDVTLDQQEPLIDYNDTSSEDEMEVEQYHSDSGKSWEEADGGTDADGASDADSHSDSADDSE